MKLDALQKAIGHRFSRLELLQQAVTHRSFGSPHNERLEFLGDSIVNCVTAIALFERFGELREGDMSRLRANLVRQEALHRLAEGLKLGEYLRLGEGEMKSGGHRRPSILADALEAIFAAVFLDAGFEAAKAVIDQLYASSIASLDPARALKDPKTALQEWLQGRRMPLPKYSLADARGEAHQQEFEVECEITGLGLKTRGIGVSRRAAEQQSAQRALELLPKS
ncbi:MAG: Ribonuclease [Pseudomonadota bacterium]|jgi:ribonuclease III|uniref:Ribonuclease 3 n=1 Tax=Zoogloea ramigera TaxID=350 RepID=A0A4Y4CQB2_ZOORA|nr:ribonuclease III [Zoogloea ramigera]MBP6801354.1 ribonuclease III [Zoogloea sp.]MBP7627636.1 ribonuclease III [Zoogloea sp.]GEC95098.1 ribonuclease 3 [Zoogloea ramigera]